MSPKTKRSILRCFHIILSIPILGYIYATPAEAQQYAGPTRYVFVPAMLLSGYWMFAGVYFAIIAVVAWLVTFRLSGYGATVLVQVVLFIARKIWLVVKARRSARLLYP